MRILIDIGHPAHVHLFKYFALEMQKKGHDILFTVREKEFEKYLLSEYGLKYTTIGRKYYSKLGKIFGLLKFDIKEFYQGLKFNPDLFLSAGSFYASHAAYLLRKPHISLEDTGNLEQVRLYLPFTNTVLTPNILLNDFGPRQIRYSGYHELAYLHPKRFKPDQDILNYISGGPGAEYAILRFVSWKASHDKNQIGFSYSEKVDLINFLSGHFQLFISSESTLPKEFEKYSIPFPPYLMHEALSRSTIVISEGSTIASEAAILGIPSIYVSSIKVNLTEDEEKYGLVFNHRNGKNVIKRVEELLRTENLRSVWKDRKNELLKDKIDVTGLLVWFIENYPESVSIMKETPDYQYNFT